MSDTPCVDGCGQDAATIERLREQLGYLLGQYDRAVDVHEGVVMDTPEQRALHDKAIAAMRQAAEPVRAALTPQNVPQDAVDAPEAPGQPGRGEEGPGGRTGREWGDITTVSDPDRHYVCSQCGATKTEPRCTEAP